MRPSRVLLPLLLVSVTPHPAFAQYKVGDKVVVIQDAEIKVGDKVLQKVHRGVPLRVDDVKDGWLWVSNQGSGWITKQVVTTPANAIDVFTEQIRRNPQDAGAYGARGSTRMARNELDIAMNDFNEAIRLNPKNASAYGSRGLCWREKGEIDRAIADYSDAIRLDPKSVMDYANRADAWNVKGEYAKAVSDATEAIRLAPEDTYAYSYRAQAWAATKQFDKAIADCEEIRSINARGLDGYNAVAWLLATSPNPDVRDGKKAFEFAAKACELTNLKDGGAIDTLAAAYAEAGDFEAAVEWQTKALEMLPESAPGRAEMKARLHLYKSGKPFREPVNR